MNLSDPSDKLGTGPSDRRGTRPSGPAVAAIWEANAAWWDEEIGPEGNDFHRTVLAPATTRLLAPQPGEIVLDIACGNGQFARQMAAAGARVVACDASPTFIERAGRHTTDAGLDIEYHVMDVTDTEALSALGEQRFNAAVCTMALMDIPTLEPLASMLPRLLKPGARFVFSILHPAFNTLRARRVAEQEDRDGSLVTTYSISVRDYLTPQTGLGLGIVGQPQPHYDFHRPLGLLLTTFFRQGFVLDGLEEPAFPPGAKSTRTFSWANFSDIPPALVARLSLPIP